MQFYIVLFFLILVDFGLPIYLPIYLFIRVAKKTQNTVTGI